MSLAEAARVALEADFVIALLCRSCDAAIVYAWEWRRARARGADLKPAEQAEAERTLLQTMQPSDLAALKREGLLPVPVSHARIMQGYQQMPLSEEARRRIRLAQENPDDDE